ncbi:hypothetical protein [Cryobacterium psychrophilum]|uniref:Uncharacterized protein n=1 Tax=Cryobacterium psychrophilum TaxID=41988 RepID=A0A4Y8KQ81_9MICO|nr:hypothetical protein [Cryobacterium psychrophilum]TFD81070.1 hypothetical protein E3T53_03565 [Cryobacterium psychrophilum]
MAEITGWVPECEYPWQTQSADVVLMRSNLLNVPIALRIGIGIGMGKMRQNLSWAACYNAVTAAAEDI